MQRTSADQVHVEVEHGLSGPLPDVQHGAVAILNRPLSGNVRRGEEATANEFRVFWLSFLQARNMFLGKDEYVRRALGVDIVKGEGVLVFVDFLGGNFTADNTAEQTISHNLVSICPRGVPQASSSRAE
jgi:hypothetical protein